MCKCVLVCISVECMRMGAYGSAWMNVGVCMCMLLFL